MSRALPRRSRLARQHRAGARGLGWLTALYLLISGTPAAAQVAIIDPVPDYVTRVFNMEGRAVNQFSTDIQSGGHFDRLRYDLAATGGGSLNQNIRVSLYTRYTQARYDFLDSPAPTCPDLAACFEIPPWQNENAVDITPGLALAIGDSIQIITLVPLRWSGETDSDETGMTAGAIAAVRLSLGDSFSGVLGIGVQSELASDASVFPVIGLEWRITDSLELRTTGAPYQGGGAELVWGPADAVQLKLSAGYERRRFRLSRNSPNANGVGQYTSVPLEIGLRLNLSPRFWLDLSGGLAVAGELRLDAPDRTILSVSKFDTAGLLGGALGLTF